MNPNTQNNPQTTPSILISETQNTSKSKFGLITRIILVIILLLRSIAAIISGSVEVYNNFNYNYFIPFAILALAYLVSIVGIFVKPFGVIILLTCLVLIDLGMQLIFIRQLFPGAIILDVLILGFAYVNYKTHKRHTL